jgi:rRNA maturation endonuclease Nob1
MQSVLMQMGLPLMGADGLLLRSIKRWVLRCSGCFTCQSSLEKQVRHQSIERAIFACAIERGALRMC